MARAVKRARAWVEEVDHFGAWLTCARPWVTDCMNWQEVAHKLACAFGTPDTMMEVWDSLVDWDKRERCDVDMKQQGMLDIIVKEEQGRAYQRANAAGGLWAKGQGG